jgi:DNA-directed RNA polymerase subunit K/omega
MAEDTTSKLKKSEEEEDYIDIEPEEESENEIEEEAEEGEEEEPEGEEEEPEGEEAEEPEGEEAEEPEEEAEEPEEEAEQPVGDDDDTIKKTKTKRTIRKSKTVNSISGIEMLEANNTIDLPAIEDESDEEFEEDDFYLQKIDNELRDDFILNHHPESRTHNYEEVKAMTRISRDGRGIIVDPLHKTLPFLTKYEMTRVLGQRAKQLDSGAKSFIKVPLNIIDGYYIAKLELEQKKLPFIIKRPLPNGGVEYWHVSDLEVL